MAEDGAGAALDVGGAPPPRVLGAVPSRLLRAWFRGPDHPAKLRLWYALRRRTGFPRIRVPYGGGVVSVDERDLVGGRLFTDGTYEPEVHQALQVVLRPGDVFWDVGAHIGTFSVLALAAGVAEVVAVEPAPDTAAVLRANLALNPGVSRVVEVALGERVGEGTLHRAPLANTGLASLATDRGLGGRPVAVSTVDELVFRGQLPPPDVVKLDVEGWEVPVLAGAARLLAERPPRAILLEAGPDPDGPGGADAATTAPLRAAGYTVRPVPRLAGPPEARENFLALHAGPGT